MWIKTLRPWYSNVKIAYKLDVHSLTLIWIWKYEEMIGFDQWSPMNHHKSATKVQRIY